MTDATVTLYAIEESFSGGKPAKLVSVECKETAKRYTAIQRAPLAWRFRQTLDKGSPRIHFTPADAWSAFERAKSNHVTRLREELAASERDLELARAALAAAREEAQP